MIDTSSMERVPTGIPGLDPILEGGLLKGGVYIVQGPPGSGKTILGNQFCFSLARSGRQAVFVTLLAESHTRMLSHLRRMTFFDARLIPERVFYVSALKILESEGLEGLVRTLREMITSRKVSLIVLDGFVSAEEAAPSPADLKKFIHQIQSITGMTGSTALLLSSTERATTIRPEHTMVDGIIELTDDLATLGPLRRLRVRKMRGADQIRGQHTVEITNDGMIVHPRLETQLQRLSGRGAMTPGGGRMAFGVPGLDEMLHGGLPENSVTMLLGPSGTGKTILGLQFLVEGARRGEPGVYFGFYEHPEGIREKSRRLKLELEELEAAGLLHIVWQPAFEGIIDILSERLFSAIKSAGARRLFIDGMQGFQLALDDVPTRMRGVFSAIAEELERLSVTSVYTLEPRELFGPTIEVPIGGVSAASQNLILLRYMELRSQIYRTISIVKVRDSDYDASTRELRVTSSGIVVGGAFPGDGAPVTGSSVAPSAPERVRGKSKAVKKRPKAGKRIQAPRKRSA